jgi:methyl-accepting chemotaxis protein
MNYQIQVREPIHNAAMRLRIAAEAAKVLGGTAQQLEVLLGREAGSVIARANSEAQAQHVASVFSSLGAQVEVVTPLQPSLEVERVVRRGLGRRILFGALLPLLIAGIILAGYLALILPNIFNNQLENRALSAAITGSIAIDNKVNFALEDATDLNEVKRIVRGLGRQVSAVAFAGVLQGKIIAFENRLGVEDTLLQNNLETQLKALRIDVRKTGAVNSQTAVLTYAGVPYTVGVVGTGSGNIGSRIFVGLTQDRMRQDLLQTLLPTLLVVLVALAVTALLATGLIARIVRPIVKLTQKANQMSSGDLEQPIELTSNDEIGDLAEALERMRTSLKLLMNRSKRQHLG